MSPRTTIFGKILKFRTPTYQIKWHIQTVLTSIRELLKEQTDQDLHYLLFHQEFYGLNA